MTVFVFVPSFYLIGNSWFIPVQVTGGVLAALSYFFSTRRYIHLSLYVMFSAVLFILFYASIEAPGTGVEYFLIPLGLTPFIIIENKKIYTGLFIVTFTAFWASHFLQKMYVPHHVISDFYTELTFVIVLIAVFTSCAIVIFQFKIINAEYEIIIGKQKLILENKNKDITDSINYAKRIQQAKLPIKEEIRSALPQSFVLFKPKDIVSGDFYFFRHSLSPLGRVGERRIFIAAADCTGHGVPGAFISIIGSERLEDAVSQSEDPSQILKLLNKGVKISLHQSDSDDSTRDGMDIALCSIDMKNYIVKYAGANRPLWVIRKGQKEIKEIKATKMAIGGLTDDEQHFDTHELQLQEGDTFYIFSDGYADTFGGKDGKKLTTKRLKEILLEMEDKTMEEQEKFLDNFIESWKAGKEQLDDILIIGVRL